MPRRSRLFSLSSLTRAYQRNLKAFARATRPVRAKASATLRAAAKAGKVPAVARAIERERLQLNLYKPAG